MQFAALPAKSESDPLRIIADAACLSWAEVNGCKTGRVNGIDEALKQTLTSANAYRNGTIINCANIGCCKNTIKNPIVNEMLCLLDGSPKRSADMTNLVRVIIADVHPLFADAIGAQIERAFPGSYIRKVWSTDELVSVAASADIPFDLFLMELGMPGLTAASISDLGHKYPTALIALMAESVLASEAKVLVEAGARGFIPKTATGEYLVHAIEVLLSGGTTTPAGTSLMGPTQATAGPWGDLLTSREREILRAVVRGMPNKEIGRELQLAEVTIKVCLHAIFQKIGAKNRYEAAAIASRAGVT